MDYQIIYLPVGEKSSSGESILIRYGDLHSTREEQVVVLIDGGYASTGELVEDYCSNLFDTNHINHVILTHPDRDHASGLKYVIENMKVDNLYFNPPWDYAEKVKNIVVEGKKYTDRSSIENKIQKSLVIASDVVDAANENGVNIVNVFAGDKITDNLFVLGPSEDYFRELVDIYFDTQNLVSRVAQKTKEFFIDLFHEDNLDDEDDTTSPRNNSSIIMAFGVEEERVHIFTGDAGKTAIDHALNHYESMGGKCENIYFLDVPHHGSKRNINSRIINKISPACAYISAAPESEKHPSQAVINALKKANVSSVSSTKLAKGGITLKSPNAPVIPGSSPLTEHEFVESYEE